MARDSLTDEEIIRACLLEITPWASSGTCIPFDSSQTPGVEEEDDAVISCDTCGSTDPPVSMEGRRMCPNCGVDGGMVLVCNTTGRTIDRNNSNIERVGAPIDPHLPKSSMGTSIRWSRSSDMMRIRKFHQWGVMPSSERGLYQVYRMIATHCSQEGDVISKKAQNTAKTMYQIIADHYRTRGAKRKGLIAACVYYACKAEGCPRDPSAIAEMFRIRNKDISNGIRTYQTVTSGIDHPVFRETESSTAADDYVGRYCTRLGVSDPQVVRLAEAMCKKIAVLGVCDGYTPTTVALSVLSYIFDATDPTMTHRAFCKITDVSPGTVSRCKKAVKVHEEDILPKSVLRVFRASRIGTSVSNEPFEESLGVCDNPRKG